MVLEISQNEFCSIVGTPTTQATDLFNRVKTFFDGVQSQLEKELNYKVADMPTDNIVITAETKTFICLMSYYSAIPTLDLTWTATGFGVVQNNTLAPASRERVSALRDSIYLRAIESKYRLLNELYCLQAFADAQSNNNFVFTFDVYKKHGGSNISVKDFDDTKTAFEIASRKLWRVISKAETQRLCMLAQHANVPDYEITDTQKETIRLITQFCIESERDHYGAMLFIPVILETVNDENNKTDFPLYWQSSECEANNEPPYENTADKPTFFFI